mmetsp:Transcript_32037/g.92693  ORF Transcript_32037/g.92693 Transcript_32037/m.92693 type:complete len:240 (-) Transcript_32037:194-913(-)
MTAMMASKAPFLAALPSKEYSTEPPFCAAFCRRPARMVVAPTNTSFGAFLSPCHVYVHPPLCTAMLSAPLPTTSSRDGFFSGRICLSFLSRTSDFCTASRATFRWPGAPREWPMSLSICARRCGDGRGLPCGVDMDEMKPMRALTLRIRVTASSMRSIGTMPARTCLAVFSMKPTQSLLVGTMNMSMPALTEGGQDHLVQEGHTQWCPSQSLMTSPSNPRAFFKTPLMRYSWACSCRPL